MNLDRAQRNYNRKKENAVAYKRHGASGQSSLNTGQFNDLVKNEQSIDNSM